MYKKDIGELKSFNKPPQLVKDISCAVITVLLNEQTMEWKDCKKAMADPRGFVQALTGVP